MAAEKLKRGFGESALAGAGVPLTFSIRRLWSGSLLLNFQAAGDAKYEPNTE